MQDQDKEDEFYDSSKADDIHDPQQDITNGEVSPVSKMNKPPQHQEEKGGEFYFRSSPLPDPEDLKKYNEIVPGFAEKMLNSYVTLSSEEVVHRRKIEIKHVALQEKSLALEEKNLDIYGEIAKANSKRSNIGLYTCFLVLILLIGCGGYATHKNNTTIAVTIFGGAMSALVINYASVIYGTKKIRQAESEENNSKILESSKQPDSE
jgi:uncharacterized membrane protein